MKRLLASLLALLFLLMLAACGSSSGDDGGGTVDVDIPVGEIDAPTPEVEPDTAYPSAAGWWTKPDGYVGLTSVYTFCMDDETGIATTYDDYGNAYEELKCWYDENGFNMDAGELFGIVTFFVSGDELLDADGYVHYVRCDPIDPADAPFTLEELSGRWYKNGGDSEALVLEGGRYRVEMGEIEMETGTARVTKHTTYFDASEYTGPAVYLEGEDGFSDTLWILEEGRLLYDDFRKDFYLPEGLGDADAAWLRGKMAMTRDDWSSEYGEGNAYLVFAFYGELRFSMADSSSSSTEVIGTWEMDSSGSVHLHFANGMEEEVVPADEIYVDALGVIFTRWPAW